MKTILIFTPLIFLSFITQAQEICLSCKGTYYLRGDKDVKDNHVTGICIKKNDLAITYDTEGSTQSKWKFSEKIESQGTTYYYWRKQYKNTRFGQLDEQIELSDVKYQYQYTSKDSTQNTAIAINGHCTPVERIGR